MGWEKPITQNTAILYNPQHSSYDAEAEKMRLNIVNSKSVVGPSATANTYYISPKGDDTNDGKSPETAWRSLANLQDATVFSTGDVFLFERNAVYRGFIPMMSGLSYGAYGEGPKPALYGSLRNYADETLWEKTERENVWRLDIGADMPDVGNIVCDHGKVCASVGKRLENVLEQDWQFFHDRENGFVYLYLSEGNPAALYSSIEVCVKKPVFGRQFPAELLSDVTIDNLCIKYSGSFGIVIGRAANITVTNCEVGYIGGSMIDARTRYGNGIEFNSHVDNALVENNWIYQCFDAGYTNQGHGATHNHVVVSNNLIEYCNYNIEVFANSDSGNGLVKDCVYEKNVLRFAGYGFGTVNRLGSSDIVASAFCYWYNMQPNRNTVIRNNVFDTAYRYLLVSSYVNDQHEMAPIVKGNAWIQNGAPNTAVALQVDVKIHGWHNFADHELSSDGIVQMITSVNKLDTAPVKILYEG